MEVMKRLMSRTDERDVEPRRRDMSSASRERRSAVVRGRASIAERRCAVVGEVVVKVGRIEDRSDMALGREFPRMGLGVLVRAFKYLNEGLTFGIYSWWR